MWTIGVLAIVAAFLWVTVIERTALEPIVGWIVTAIMIAGLVLLIAVPLWLALVPILTAIR